MGLDMDQPRLGQQNEKKNLSHLIINLCRIKDQVQYMAKANHQVDKKWIPREEGRYCLNMDEVFKGQVG